MRTDDMERSAKSAAAGNRHAPVGYRGHTRSPRTWERMEFLTRALRAVVPGAVAAPATAATVADATRLVNAAAAAAAAVTAAAAAAGRDVDAREDARQAWVAIATACADGTPAENRANLAVAGAAAAAAAQLSPPFVDAATVAACLRAIAQLCGSTEQRYDGGVMAFIGAGGVPRVVDVLQHLGVNAGRDEVEACCCVALHRICSGSGGMMEGCATVTAAGGHPCGHRRDARTRRHGGGAAVWLRCARLSRRRQTCHPRRVYRQHEGDPGSRQHRCRGVGAAGPCARACCAARCMRCDRRSRSPRRQPRCHPHSRGSHRGGVLHAASP